MIKLLLGIFRTPSFPHEKSAPAFIGDSVGVWCARTILLLAAIGCASFLRVSDVNAHGTMPVETPAACAPSEGERYAEIGYLQCQAYIAIYVDKNGNLLYAENVRSRPERWRLIKILEELDPSHCIAPCKHVCPTYTCYCSCP